MENDVKQFLSDLLKQLKSIDYIKPEDIPNIDLYMDQVTTFMDEQLAASKRYETDKILTKTMINNYTKNDLLPAPIRKKYSKEHIKKIEAHILAHKSMKYATSELIKEGAENYKNQQG